MKQPFDFEPKSLGDHLRKKRLMLGLTQPEVAGFLSVNSTTAFNWEHNITFPEIQYMPAIIQFLGYDAIPSGNSVPERLAAKRRELGWTQLRAAKTLGIDPGTWSSWESGGTIMAVAHRRLVSSFLGISEAELHLTMRKRWNDAHGRPTRSSK